MKVYSPAEVAKQLSCQVSTLRKYSILLENAGIKFNRNSQNQRWYSDNDIMTLRKFVTLKNNGDMDLKECANAVFLWINGNEVTQPLTEIDNATERSNSDITELKNMVHKQNELIGELSTRLDKQQEYINKRLNKHDDLLMQSLNESLETKKQIAAAVEKSKWWQFWKKGDN